MTHWRRPKNGDNPALFAAWNEHLGKPWSSDKRIEPKFKVNYGKTHSAIRRSLPGRVSSEITNWSGGGVYGTWLTTVGSWTIPTVRQPVEGPGVDGGWDSSSWVGLDGSGSNDVLQAGVEQRVDGNGNASYYAWFEWYCGFQKQTLGDTSPFSPSLASLPWMAPRVRR